jgi:hypothetical protein
MEPRVQLGYARAEHVDAIVSEIADLGGRDAKHPEETRRLEHYPESPEVRAVTEVRNAVVAWSDDGDTR